MKSVGEVMAIGRTFKESLNKALRSLEIDVFGLSKNIKNISSYSTSNREAIRKELKKLPAEDPTEPPDLSSEL